MGNFLALNVLIEKQINLLLINIYGPNKDSPDFFMNLKEFIQNNDHDFAKRSHLCTKNKRYYCRN